MTHHYDRYTLEIRRSRVSGQNDSWVALENLAENLILLAASVVAVWAMGFFFVAYTAATSGASAHEENRRVSTGDVRSAFRGELKDDDGLTESRGSFGLAFNVRSGQLVSQGRISDEATDEVIGAKV